jgi:hypothetical protein
MIKLLSVKRFASLLLLLYGCQMAQSNKIETYLTNRKQTTVPSSESVLQSSSTLACLSNYYNTLPNSIQKSILKVSGYKALHAS